MPILGYFTEMIKDKGYIAPDDVRFIAILGSRLPNPGGAADALGQKAELYDEAVMCAKTAWTHLTTLSKNDIPESWTGHGADAAIDTLSAHAKNCIEIENGFTEARDTLRSLAASLVEVRRTFDEGHVKFVEAKNQSIGLSYSNETEAAATNFPQVKSLMQQGLEVYYKAVTLADEKIDNAHDKLNSVLPHTEHQEPTAAAKAVESLEEAMTGLAQRRRLDDLSQEAYIERDATKYAEKESKAVRMDLDPIPGKSDGRPSEGSAPNSGPGDKNGDDVPIQPTPSPWQKHRRSSDGEGEWSQRAPGPKPEGDSTTVEKSDRAESSQARTKSPSVDVVPPFGAPPATDPTLTPEQRRAEEKDRQSATGSR
ncbi:hypothetical protein D5S18_13905 [Nocardia panacis]|uniref:Uncharacterized protein n=2 Tax=Nocardia panacis TaxID=2340916 RepID=A0A3A4KL24_9NOCA|nr:hypothetical protein D5S18_13905 [Nocardia panacis]